MFLFWKYISSKSIKEPNNNKHLKSFPIIQWG